MKPKHIVILVVLLVLLAGASLLLIRREQSSWQALPSVAGGKVLAPFDPNAVAQVRIKAGDHEVTLIRRDQGWTVAENGGYPADFDRVSALVRKLWDLKVVQDVAAGTSQLERLQLTDPNGKSGSSGTLVEFKDSSGKQVAGLLAGKTYMRSAPDSPQGDGGIPAGRYLMALDGNHRIVLVSDPFSELASPAKDWLRKEFLHIGNPKSLALQSAQQQWRLERASDNGPWTLAGVNGGTAPDSSKVEAIVNALRAPAFEDVASPSNAAKYDFSHPETFTVKTFDGFTYIWTLGKLQNNAYPVKISVTGDFPAQRTRQAGEKPEDGKRLDEQFAEKRTSLEASLKDAKRFENWIFVVSQSAWSPVLVAGSDLLPPKPTPTPLPNMPPASPSVSAPQP